jgi:signal peptidase I
MLASFRWMLGLILILVAGWGLIAAAAYGAHHYHLGVNYKVAAIAAAIVSLILFTILERDMWLSRFMGLRISSRSSPLIEALFMWLLGVPGLMLRGSATADAAAEGRRGPSDVGTGREVVETIVFVVVLVLLLKSFAAEAFVIPTGSMAETLYGYQMQVTCPKCAFEFPVNASNVVDPSDGQPMLIRECTCPNCREIIKIMKHDQEDFRSGEEARAELATQKSDSSTGDRVLVAKFLYDTVNRGPNRLDVVVFKYPGDSNPSPHGPPYPESGPQKGYTPMNYIKRLCGLSGETIGIWYGKLYSLPADQLPAEKKEEYRRRALERIWENRIRSAPAHQRAVLEARRDRGEEPENWQKDLWKWEFMFRGDLDEQLKNNDGFQIIRKSPAKLLDMRRIVYDNDHPPMDLKGDQQNRWDGDSSVWSDSAPHGFQAKGPTDHTAWLRYRHILRPSPDAPWRGKRAELITDFMGYNTYEPHRGGKQPGPNWVGDLLLECEVIVDQVGGEFTMELSKGLDRFRAVFDLTSGKCTLYHLNEPHKRLSPPEDSEFSELTSKPTTLQTKGEHLVRFANVDDRLVVWVDNDTPFGDGFPYLAKSPEGPTENDLQPASLGVKGAQLQVHKLSLWRDTYYTRDPSEGTDWRGADPDWSDPETWDPLRQLAPNTFYVQPGHYLCLGDNSPESSDSRSWGQVPERLLLGRALMVYYPFTRAGRIR